MNLVQFRQDDGGVFINPAHVAMVRPSDGDGNATDVVVAAQAGLALVRVREPIKGRRRQAAPVRLLPPSFPLMSPG